MSNPQDKPLYIILFAVALAVLLMFFAGDLDASDTQVTCFSDEQVERINADITQTIRRAYNDGHTEGMMDGYKKVVETVFAQCSLPEINDIVFKHPTGEIRLSCPVK